MSDENIKKKPKLDNSLPHDTAGGSKPPAVIEQKDDLAGVEFDPEHEEIMAEWKLANDIIRENPIKLEPIEKIFKNKQPDVFEAVKKMKSDDRLARTMEAFEIRGEKLRRMKGHLDTQNADPELADMWIPNVTRHQQKKMIHLRLARLGFRKKKTIENNPKTDPAVQAEIDKKYEEKVKAAKIKKNKTCAKKYAERHPERYAEFLRKKKLQKATSEPTVPLPQESQHAKPASRDPPAQQSDKPGPSTAVAEAPMHELDYLRQQLDRDDLSQERRREYEIRQSELRGSGRARGRSRWVGYQPDRPKLYEYYNTAFYY